MNTAPRHGSRGSPGARGNRPARDQRGQAAVLTYVFLAVLVVSGLFLYKAGKLTSDKMQMQNAADAAAYSASVIEARDLNFAAYMNRAIIANEVAIGQLVGLASWAFHWGSFADFLMTYDTLIISPATLGVSTGPMQAVTNALWRVPANSVFLPIATTLANFGTTVLHNINRAYGIAQYAFHAVSVANAIGVLDDVLTRNAPPGTKVSDFGIIAIAAHIASYGAIPFLPGTTFTEGYSPTRRVPYEPPNPGDDSFVEGGYGRLSAMINEAGDPFLRGRGWELRPPGFPIDETISFTVDLGLAGLDVSLWFRFDLALERKGGAHIRVKVPTGSQQVSAGDMSWSSADTTTLDFELGGGGDFTFWVRIPFVGRVDIVSAGASALLGNDRFVVTLDLGGAPDCSQVESDVEQVCEDSQDIIDDGNSTQAEVDQATQDCADAQDALFQCQSGSGWTLVDLPFPTSYPFGAGFAQAAKTANALTATQMNLDDFGGPIKNEFYGESGSKLLAWVAPGPGPAPTPAGVLGQCCLAGKLYPRDHQVNKTYGGLPHFVDTTGEEETLWGFGAPNLLIGLVLDEEDFDLASDGNPEREPAGRFALTEGLADQELAVIAKSQVYFKRPFLANDPASAYFGREDGEEEFGSAFNPFWQARLVETSYLDRLLAALVQQKQDFIQIGRSLTLLWDDIMDLMP